MLNSIPSQTEGLLLSDKLLAALLFLKAVVIMIVRHLHNVHELLSVLAQPTTEMRILRLLLTQQERFPSRRTWEQRQISDPSDLACADWLPGSTSGRSDPAVDHERTSRCHR